MKKKTIQKEITMTVDTDTGEMVDVTIKKVQMVIDTDKFALVYASFWDIVTGSNLSKSDIELFGYLVNNYGDGTEFSITANMKQKLSNKSGKSSSSYNNSVKHLVEVKFILPMTKRSYIINPVYAFQGSSTTRKKLILELDEQHKIIQ